MTTETTHTSHRESAMRDGTLLGCLWIVTFTVSTIMLRHIVTTPGLGFFSLFAVISLTVASPILAFNLSKKHWSTVEGGNASFANVWFYLITMYICAILLSSVAQYIYYEYCDPYIFQDFVEDFSKVKIQGDEEGLISKSIIEQYKAMDKMPTIDIVLAQASGHTTRGMLVTALLALIVSRNLKNKIEQ